jgi:hypothetical protein
MNGRDPIIIRASALLLGAVVLTCVALLVPPLWAAVLKVWQSGPGGQECSMLKEPAARQTCERELSDRASRTPPKGD